MGPFSVLHLMFACILVWNSQATAPGSWNLAQSKSVQRLKRSDIADFNITYNDSVTDNHPHSYQFKYNVSADNVGNF